MIKEVKILIDENEHKSKTGSVLESLVRNILETQQYDVHQNINATGLELDLLANHRIKNEILYVECKAKQKPKSTEIKNFVFCMDYGVAETIPQYGYFIYTQQLDHQAIGLKLQLEKQKPNITFLGPDMIIELLCSSNKIKALPYQQTENDISKLFLIYSNHGFFYVPIYQEGNIPQYFSIINAKTSASASEKAVNDIKSQLKEIEDLTFIQFENESQEIYSEPIPVRDTILPVRESENWYDYSPASFQHFIGRMSIRRNLKGFLEKVRTGKTKNRIFFLDGKSGWGKSSLIAELKGSSTELKYWKGRIEVLAIDTRSASTANFVGLAFKKLVDESIKNSFLTNDLFKTISISSPYEILADGAVEELTKELKKKKRLLVIIFDQFEDQFRKENLFEAFYRFCLDIDSLRENIVVGFSWKSEINIPLGNSAYHKFNQLKEFSYKITVPEFSKNDAKQIIRQLETTIGEPLGNDLERKLIESSQGYPWLIKKLCIHIFNQYNSGKSTEEISEQELNCKELFEYDLLSLTGESKKALEYIAQRAYDGNPFEISEFDKIGQDILDSLINQRLIIRTGSAYNIYWDIFRDYIVTKEMPVIGESYILRQSGRGCLSAFLAFDEKNIMSMNEIQILFPNDISEKSLFNILLELSSIGLIKKQRGQDIFELTNKVEEVSEEFFKKYLTEKFKNYTPYLELQKLKKNKIDLDDILSTLKGIFKTENFAEETWSAYAKNLIIWFNMSNLELKSRLVEIRKGRGGVIPDRLNQIPFYSPKEILKEFENFTKNKEVDERKYRDFQLLELIDNNEDLLIDIEEESINQSLMEKALELVNVKLAYDFLLENPKAKSVDIINSRAEMFENYSTITSKRQRATILLAWANFIEKVKDGKSINLSSKRSYSGKYYLSSGPQQVLDILGYIDSGEFILTEVDSRKLKDIEYIGLIGRNNSTYYLADVGYNVLNSPDPEKELANVASIHEDIRKFMEVQNSEDKKRKRAETIKQFSSLFPGLMDSSIYTKINIYNSWSKFIKIYEN